MNRSLAALFCVSLMLVLPCHSVAQGDSVSVGAPVLIENSELGDAGFPQIAVDASHNAIAVWTLYDGVNTSVWANRYRVGKGWGKAGLIENNAGDAYFSPRIAAAPSGDAVAVWEQEDGTRNGIWANRYTIGKGWGTAEIIEADSKKHAFHPEVAVDASGNAVAVWDDESKGIWANYYTAGVGWGKAVMVDAPGFSPQVAFGPTGNAIAVWDKYDGDFHVMASLFMPGTGWSTPELIERSGYSSQVGVDSMGNVIVVWEHYEVIGDVSIEAQVRAIRYEAGKGWGASERIAVGGNNLNSEPQLAVASSGNAIAVWHNKGSIVGNVYTVGKGWGTAEVIETTAHPDRNASLAFDSSGSAIAVWISSDGNRNNVMAREYTPGQGWGTAASVSEDVGGDDFFHPAADVAVGPSGNAFIVWEQADGKVFSIWASHIAIDGAPPLVPVPSIRANNTGGELSISHNTPLSLEVALEAGTMEGIESDWWFVTATPLPAPLNWFSYNLAVNWWTPGQKVTHQGPALDLKPATLPDLSKLPIGKYIFYFGIDTNRNGQVDFGELFYDKIVVTVTE